MDHATKARQLFRSGYSCAQSLVAAFSEEMGMDVQTAAKMASSFGGGMGGLREYCGAVTGMVLVLGVLMGYGTTDDYDAKKNHYARVRALEAEFRAQQGTCCCRDLLASLPGKLEKDPLPRTEEYYKIRPCIRYVECGARILEKLLQDEGVLSKEDENDEKPLATQAGL